MDLIEVDLSDGSECISLLTTELRDRVTEVQQSPK